MERIPGCFCLYCISGKFTDKPLVSEMICFMTSECCPVRDEKRLKIIHIYPGFPHPRIHCVIRSHFRWDVIRLMSIHRLADIWLITKSRSVFVSGILNRHFLLINRLFFLIWTACVQFFYLFFFIFTSIYTEKICA